MLRPICSTLSLSCICVILIACAPQRPPIPTGVVPAAKPLSISDEQYGHSVLEQLSERYELDYNDPRLEQLNRIVARLTKAANADKEPWHIYLFKAPQVKNAAATRGNHLFVWSGLLDYTKTEDELATVLGHEIAHLLAGHTDPDPNQRVKQILIGIGAIAAGVAVNAATGGKVSSSLQLGDLTADVAKGVGEGFLLNPYSREKEMEADQIGFFLMADAGYDPKKAVSFWARAEKDPDFATASEFFSSHPAAGERMAQLQSLLPRAEERYAAARSGSPLPRSKVLAQNSVASPAPPKEKERSSVPQLTLSAEKTAATPPSVGSTNATSAETRFDWNDSQTSDTVATEADSQWPERVLPWRVVVSKALLYPEADANQQPIGEFVLNATVYGIRRSGRWLEIYSPQHGFLRIEELASPVGQ